MTHPDVEQQQEESLEYNRQLLFWIWKCLTWPRGCDIIVGGAKLPTCYQFTIMQRIVLQLRRFPWLHWRKASTLDVQNNGESVYYIIYQLMSHDHRFHFLRCTIVHWTIRMCLEGCHYWSTKCWKININKQSDWSEGSNHILITIILLTHTNNQ